MINALLFLPVSGKSRNNVDFMNIVRRETVIPVSGIFIKTVA
jgi:hypothetical protein